MARLKVGTEVEWRGAGRPVHLSGEAVEIRAAVVAVGVDALVDRRRLTQRLYVHATTQLTHRAAQNRHTASISILAYTQAGIPRHPPTPTR